MRAMAPPPSHLSKHEQSVDPSHGFGADNSDRRFSTMVCVVEWRWSYAKITRALRGAARLGAARRAFGPVVHACFLR
jgi:hypothetical protein